MDKKRIEILFQKHLKGELRPAEQEELKQGLHLLDEDTFSAWVDKYITVEENHLFSKEEVRNRIESRIASDEHTSTTLRRFMKHPAVAVAALLVLMLSVALWVYRMGGGERAEVLKIAENDGALRSEDLVLPEKQSMVTLADGTEMLFNMDTNDTIRHKGLEILRTADGSLVMRQENPNNGYFGEDARHRVAAPKGVALRVVLPDSSLVWLNSGSSIGVWASYNRRTRGVELQGEGYFDVRHDDNNPFYVTAKGVTVKVLGTTFNLSAYEGDKEVKTTLIEGKVDVSAARNSLILQPGQQAVVNDDTSIQLHTDVNVNLIMAWKDGFFRFRDEPIANILRELQKWYPISAIEIAEGNTDKFTGSIRRSKKLLDILAAIEEVSDLSFDVKEGRVIVMK